MIPVLFEKNATVFRSNGIGRLYDAISCIVSERINDFYNLSMEYAADGQYASSLKPGRIVFAVPADGEPAQPFRIAEVNKTLSGTIDVQANHISYDLSGIPIRPIDVSSASGAIGALSSRAILDSGFTFSTNVSKSAALVIERPGSIRAAMGGSDDSILGVYGGEWKYNLYECRLLNARGTDNGAMIRYGKNMIDLEALGSGEEDYTGTFAYYLNGGTYVSSNVKYIKASAVPQKILIVDHTSDFQSTPTTAQLDTKATADFAKVAGVTTSLSVSFAALWQFEEFRGDYSRVKLGDRVTVVYEKYDLNTKLEVVQTDYDVLLDRYENIELGTITPTLADTIAGLKKK